MIRPRPRKHPLAKGLCFSCFRIHPYSYIQLWNPYLDRWQDDIAPLAEIEEDNLGEDNLVSYEDTWAEYDYSNRLPDFC